MQSALKPLGLESSDAWFELYREIAHHLKIHSEGWISHSDYPDDPPSPDVLRCFNQLPSPLQRQYLSFELQNFLYEAYYTGTLQQNSQATTDERDRVVLINDTVNGVNVDFFEALDRSNFGTGYFDSGWRICKQESDGNLAVIKDGLTIHIDPKEHNFGEHPRLDEMIAIRLPHHFIERDYYVAVSDTGQIHPDHAIVNLFFNVDANAAVSLMSYFTQALNVLKLPFTLQLLYLSEDYGRYDSGILSIAKNQLNSVWHLVQTFYLQYSSCFNTDVPWMTKRLAPGLAIAEQPTDLSAAQPCFGLHRCKIIAESLLDADGDDSVPGRMEKLIDRFSQLGLDLHRPYLNSGSGDFDINLVL